MAARKATPKDRFKLPLGNKAGEIKGPDPDVWGDDDDRPSSTPQIEGAQLVGMVGDDGEEVKGPDPQQHPRK